MAKNDNLQDFLTDIADTIRIKKKTTDPINPQDFSTEIANLSEDLETEITEQETLLNELEADVNSLRDKPDGEYFVKVIDYDGTILKEANLNTGDTFTLPNAPSHDGLIFQEWSCSQDIVDGVITIEDNNVMVGAVYTTASGLSEFDIEITKAMEADIATSGYVVTLNMDGTKDWGDGTSDDLTTHTYTNYGKYTIKCNGTTMTTSSSSGLFGQGTSNQNQYCIGVRFKNITTISNYAFQHCYALRTITIPNGVTSIEKNAFMSCISLKNITIPNGVTTINASTFQYCYSLGNITIPNGVTTINASVFQECYSLTSVVIPGITSVGGYMFKDCRSLTNVTILNGVTKLSTEMFYQCFSLKNITIPNSVITIDKAFYSCLTLTNIKIPNSVTTIKSNAFRICQATTIFDFSTHTRVPTLENISAFNAIRQIAKIIVPDNLYDDWIVATNWSTYANYIYKASEVQ